MASAFSYVGFDSANPRRQAEFWAAVLDWQIGDASDTEASISGPPGSGPQLYFSTVPEGKGVKNRLHLDISPRGCDQQQELERLLALGARHVDIGQGEQTWIVLADPEGNEFCLLQSSVD